MVVLKHPDRALLKLGCVGPVKHIRGCATPTVGVVGYTAPEVLQGSAHSAPSSVWSLSSCVAELLSGQPVYRALTTHEAFQRCLHEPHPTLPARMSQQASRFLTWCWSKSPSGRPSAAQLLKGSAFLAADYVTDFSDHTAAGYMSPPKVPHSSSPKAPLQTDRARSNTACAPGAGTLHSCSACF